MKKAWFKKHIKFVIGIIVGMAIPALVYAATILYASSEVSYDNTATGFESTDVQGALSSHQTIWDKVLCHFYGR